MKKTAFSLAIFLLFFVLLPALVLAKHTTNNLDINTSNQPAGFHDVFVHKDGQWEYAGNLNYNKYLREKKVDLNQRLPAESKARIRLVQKGGGAAHIDSVLLGGLPPARVTGCDDSVAVTKLAKSDYDVVDAYQKTLVLTFIKSFVIGGHKGGMVHNSIHY